MDINKLPDEMEIIDSEAILEIRMSTTFFNRIQQAFNSVLESKSQEDIASAFEQIKTKNIKDVWVQNLETLMILINEFQKKAKEEGKVKKIKKEDFLKTFMQKDAN